MTNEELDEKVRALHDRLEHYSDDLHPDARQHIAEAMRDLVSQAYEEAANITEHSATVHWCENESDVREDLAAQIRALKDSLSPETIPS